MIMNRMSILCILAALLAGISCDNSKDAPRGVVLILCDDLSAHLAVMGTPAIRTPATDALAEEGVLFTNAFSACASCSPSRSSILTGMYPHSNGHWRNTFTPRITDPEIEFSREREKPYDVVGVWDHVPTLTEVLSEQGVFTGITNKFHLSPTWRYHFDARLDLGSAPGAFHDMVLALLDSAGSKPFFFQVNVNTPHRNFNRHLKNHEGKLPDIDSIEVPPFLADTELMRRDLQAYYACVEVADRCAGAVMDALKERGEYEDVLLIFTSDQGMAYHRAKASPYYAGTHIPMIIRGPGVEINTRSDELVSLIDLMPTILDHLRIDTPGNVQGKSLMPILKGQSGQLEGRDHIFTEHNSHGPAFAEFYPSRAVFDGRYYYIKNLVPEKAYLLPADLEFEKNWDNLAFRATIEARESHPMQYKLLMEMQEGRPPEELYDMDEDFGQLLNLAGDPDFDDVRRELAGKVETWMAETGDSIVQIMGLD
jgi:N-sulfoglucosamine sulfohydrolase